MALSTPPSAPPMDSIITHAIRTGCTPYPIAGLRNSYGYRPHLSAGIVFVTLFTLALLLHLIRLIRFRRWTFLLLATAALAEAIGWAARTWSARCPYNHTAFLMQITILIIAPTFFTAALNSLFSSPVQRLGRETSVLLSPRRHALIFCACDVVSLVVQAVGAAMASKASNTIWGIRSLGRG